MSYKVGGTTVIDTSGNVPWAQIAGKPVIPSVTDISLLYLYAAENKGNRLNMVGGIIDPLTSLADVATYASLVFSSTNSNFVLDTSVLAPKDMASATTPAPLVASSSSGTTGWKAFSSVAGYGGAGASSGWYLVDLGVVTPITNYFITPILVPNGYYWRQWQFLGSNDGVTFTTLDSKYLTTGWTSNVQRQFAIPPAAYRYYKWNVSSLGTAGLEVTAGRLGVIVPAPTFPTTLASTTFTAAAVPAVARLGVQAVGSLAANLDLKGYVSRDGGTTWSLATLVLIDTLVDGTKYYEDAAVNLSSQPSGTAMQYKIVTTSANWTSTNGVLLQWS